MASWLEQLGGDLSEATSTIIGAGAGKLASELGPDQPANKADRPEQQYDTDIPQPTEGPKSKVTSPMQAFNEVWGQYKWWIAGGLAVVAVLAVKGAR